MLAYFTLYYGIITDFELNLHTLTVELEQLTNPIKFGILLRVPQHILEIIKKNQPLGEFMLCYLP